VFFDKLLRAAAGTTSPDEKAISEKIRGLEERREELAAEWATGDLTKKEWHTARRKISDELDRLTRSLSRNTHTLALAQFAAMEGDVWDRWESLTNGARRALVEAAADPITVYPAKVRGRAKFDPDRIKPKWRA
jgi:hypothetical protein